MPDAPSGEQGAGRWPEAKEGKRCDVLAAELGALEQGAKQIGNGSVGPGVKQTAKGIGNTVVEEFFKKAFGS